MAQLTNGKTYEVENKPDFKLYRLHVNDIFAAIRSGNAGPEEPETTYAYMTWVKTVGADWEVYQRNANNTAWVLLQKVESGALVLPSSIAPPAEFDDAEAWREALGAHDADNLTTGSVHSDRLPTVPIAKGGTGQTTAAGAMGALYQPGMVVQTQIAVKTSNSSNPSQVFTSLGLSVSITPKYANSIILVSLNCTGVVSSSAPNTGFGRLGQLNIRVGTDTRLTHYIGLHPVDTGLGTSYFNFSAAPMLRYLVSSTNQITFDAGFQVSDTGMGMVLYGSSSMPMLMVAQEIKQ